MDRRSLDSWFRVSVFFFEDERTARVSTAARELLLKAIAYAKRNRTDGRIPKNIMLTLYSPVNHETGEIDLKLSTKWIRKCTASGHPVITQRALTRAVIVSVKDTICELIDARLVTILDNGMYHITNFLKWQESAEEIENKRESAAAKRHGNRTRAKQKADCPPTRPPGTYRGTKQMSPGDIPGDKANVPRGQLRIDSDSDLDLSLSLSNTELDSESDASDAPPMRERENGKSEKSYSLEQLAEVGRARFGRLGETDRQDLAELCPLTFAEWESAVRGDAKTWRYVINGLPGQRATAGKATTCRQNAAESPVNGPTKADKARHEENMRERDQAFSGGNSDAFDHAAAQAKSIRENLEKPN